MSASYIAECIICDSGAEFTSLRNAVHSFNTMFGERIFELCNQLTHIENCVKQVAEIEFSDEKINWGRIVAFFAFGKTLSLCFPSQKDLIVQDVGKFLSERLEQWILCNGGWEPFFE